MLKYLIFFLLFFGIFSSVFGQDYLYYTKEGSDQKFELVGEGGYLKLYGDDKEDIFFRREGDKYFYVGNEGIVTDVYVTPVDFMKIVKNNEYSIIGSSDKSQFINSNKIDFREIHPSNNQEEFQKSQISSNADKKKISIEDIDGEEKRINRIISTEYSLRLLQEESIQDSGGSSKDNVAEVTKDVDKSDVIDDILDEMDEEDEEEDSVEEYILYGDDSPELPELTLKKNDDGEFIFKIGEKQVLVDDYISDKQLLIAYFKNTITLGTKEYSFKPTQDQIKETTGIDMKNLETKVESGELTQSDYNDLVQIANSFVIFDKSDSLKDNKLFQSINRINSIKIGKTGDENPTTEELVSLKRAGAIIDDKYITQQYDSLKSTNLQELENKLKTAKTDEEKKSIQNQIDNYNKDVLALGEIITREQYMVLFRNIGTDEERDEIAKAMNGQDCDGILARLTCIVSPKGAEYTVKKLLAEDIAKARVDSYDKDNNFNLEEYNLRVTNNALFRVKQLVQDYPNFDEQETRCEYSNSLDDCLIHVNGVTCETDQCLRDTRLAKDLIAQAKGSQMVDMNSVLGVAGVFLQGIMNPDQSTLQAAKLFGIEADYTNVPKFLRQDATTSICIAKIEGYLDKNVDNEGGGISSYDCKSTFTETFDFDKNRTIFEEHQKCLEVSLDLRAQRTQITPDGKVAITYSYFYRAPENIDTNIIVAVSYEENGKKKKKLLTDESVYVAKGNVSTYYGSIDLDLESEDLTKIPDEQNSFYIGILATTTSGSLVSYESTPIPLITNGDSYFSEIYTSPENSLNDRQTFEKKEIKISAEDMLSMI